MSETSIKPIIFGFFISLFCTLLAYYLVMIRFETYLPLVAGLGALQTIFQFLFFFQPWKEAKPRWSLVMFFFMVLVVFIVVGGSVWVMYNLNYHMMPE